MIASVDMLDGAMKGLDLPDAVVMLADKSGHFHTEVWNGPVSAPYETLNADTIFWIASMTKPITAVAGLQLVERGMLGLDMPAGDYLPAIDALPVLEGFSADGAPMLRRPLSRITVRQLFTHTSGLGYDAWNPLRRRYSIANDIPDVATGRLRALDAPLVCDPGTRWEYGNSAEWLGKLIETVSGERLDCYLARHVTGPLGMIDTAYELSPAQTSRRARIYQRGADGVLAPIKHSALTSPEFYPGGVGLNSTAGDYLRFLMMLLHGGELDGARILARETVAMMLTNQLGALEVRPMQTAMPAASLDYDPPAGAHWGLGALLSACDVPGRRRAGSLSWPGLRNSSFWLDPKAGVAGIFMIQLSPFGDREALAAQARFETAAYRFIDAREANRVA